ncbi:MAG: sporulation integral membrane protein YtvI [Clostridiales bacterium]|nr:sporulation integral membrane protein YtvI [Clostridiales bacterium]
MTETETRKRFLINTAYIVVLTILYYLFMRYAFWMAFPFLFSLFIAMILQRPIRFLTSKTKLKKSIASVICVLGLLLVAFGVISLIGVKIVSEIRGLFNSLAEYVKDFPAFLAKTEAGLLDFVRFLPGGLETSAANSIRDLFERLKSNEGFALDFSTLSASMGGVWSTAKAIPEFVVAIIISIVACFFMTADYDTLTGFIKRQLPANKMEAVASTKKITMSAMGKLGKSYALLMLLTFVEMVVGLNILRMVGLYKSSFLLATAVIVAVVDIVPILGTGSILIPWAIYSLISGSTGFGIGLIVLYVFIYIVRQMAEPKLVADNLDLPPILALMGMYIGAKLFGFIGLFLLPLTLMFLKILNKEGAVHLWKTRSDEDDTAEAEAQTTDNKPEKDSVKPAKSTKSNKS